MRKRKSQSTFTVSLFPFLTVLISTMGVLIVMLVLTVKSADSKARQSARERVAEVEAEQVALKHTQELHQIRSEGWQSKRQELTAEMKRARERRDYLQQELDSLDARRKELANQWADLQSEPTARTQAPLSSEALELMERERSQLAQKVEDLKSEVASLPRQTVYSVVPYSGNSGTQRRPIYVECLADRLVLQPYGIELLDADFESEPQPGNPLDAALATIRQYWLESSSDASVADPYPLLLVRPEGGGAYSAARRAMVNWVDEFGYELLSDDIQLDYGAADPALTERVRKEVAAARMVVAARAKRRETLEQQFQLARGTGGLQPARAGLEVDRVNGGFTRPLQLTADSSGQVYTGVGKRSTSPESSGQGNRTRGANKLGHLEGAQEQAQPENAAASDGKAGLAGKEKGAAVDAGGPGGNGTAGDVAPLAEKRGAGWALPLNSANRYAYVRPMRIFCSSETLVLAPEAGSRDGRIVISTGPSADEWVQELVNHVRTRVERWGPAPDNGYWRPVLRLQIMPGGEATVQKLSVLLRESGLTIESEAP